MEERQNFRNNFISTNENFGLTPPSMGSSNLRLYMAKSNIEKAPPKGPVKFSLTLSEEQKSAKAQQKSSKTSCLKSVNALPTGKWNL